ncbi:hypothetical protein, partial [Microcoleus sp. F4-D5]|uniref:hypothetical protein n=1 Tax=Microcoleus sp. F4-D5 TaxID=2818760 RepID=UPI002FD2550D
LIISDDSLLSPPSAYVPVGGAECGFKSDRRTISFWEMSKLLRHLNSISKIIKVMWGVGVGPESPP